MRGERRIPRPGPAGAVVALLAAAVLLPGAAPGAAQADSAGADSAGTAVASTSGIDVADSVTLQVEDAYPSAAVVPFGPGERMEYEVKMGIFSVGDGSLEVAGVDSVRGHPSYRIVMDLEGGIPMARVDDRFQSWVDVRSLVSRRFVQRIREAGYESDRHYEIYPEERRWDRADADDGGRMPTSFPLDDISFMYFVRTLDLTPGKEYRFHRYFKEDGNPVVVRVERRDTVEVPAGTFPTVVVRPIIRTEGLFAEGGEAELHFTDDEEHHLVYMRVKIPVVRSMTLHLRSLEEGTPLRRRHEPPDSRERDPTDEGSGARW